MITKRVASVNAAKLARLAARSMSATPERICEDQLKYDMLNVVEPAIDQRTHVQRRLNAYMNTYQLVRRNQQSRIRADSLYVLLYSRYYTIRCMIDGGNITDEDDENIKAKFRELVDKKFVSAVEFENGYNAIIAQLKTAEAAEKYAKLKEQLIAQGAYSKLAEEQRDQFYLATTETDIYIKKKLTADIGKFMTRKERALRFLAEYRFVNGWITAAGVSTVALIWPFILRG